MLRLLARTRLEPVRERASQLASSEIDWTTLVRAALAHGVVPLVAHAAERIELVGVAPELRQALRLHAEENARRAETLVAEFLSLVEAFVAIEIPAIPFKGPTLAMLAYGGIELRRAGDLDFLVHQRDVVRVGTVLRDRGYREREERLMGRPMSAVEDAAYAGYQCEYQFVRDADGAVVEPHWAIAPRTMAVALDYEGMWRRARPRPLRGRDVLAFSAEDLLIILCVHGAKHDWAQLRWICDVSELLASHVALDAGACLALARSQGCERMVLVGLALARTWLDCALPPEAERRLAADTEAIAIERELGRRLFREDHEPPSIYVPTLLRARIRERWRDRIAYTVRTTATPLVEHVRLVALPARLRALYVPVRLWHDYGRRPLRRAARGIWRARQTLAADWPARRRARHVLVIDWIPHVAEGSGFPRMAGILRVLVDAGYRVTFYPVQRTTGSSGVRSTGLPPEVEVATSAGIEEINGFFARRWHQFGVILVSRPAVMAQVGQTLARHPEFGSRARVVYDAEAIFALRDIEARRLRGALVDDATAASLVHAELELTSRADAVLVVSAREAELFARHRGDVPGVLPHVLRPAPTTRPFVDRRGLLFVGRLAEDWLPNTDSLVWFLDCVFPLIRRQLAARGEEPSLTVAGRLGAIRLQGRTDAGVRFVGRVDDLRPLYDEARVFVAPTRFGAGVPLKVYEAASYGLPVAASTLLAEQLAWRDGHELLAAESSDAAGFAARVTRLYTEAALWDRIRAGALARVAEDASPERARAVLESAFATPRRRHV